MSERRSPPIGCPVLMARPTYFHFTRAIGRIFLASIAACGFRDLHIHLPASWEECLAIYLNTATRLLSSSLPRAADALADNYDCIPIENLEQSRNRPTAGITPVQYYNVSNIRYLATRLGFLRRRTPHIPPTDRKCVEDGSLVCISTSYLSPTLFKQANPAFSNL